MSMLKKLTDLLRELIEQGIDPDDIAVNSDDIWQKGSDLENEDED